MRHCLKTVLALSCLVLGLQFTSLAANATTTAPKLTAAQCAALQKDLNAYIAFVNKYFSKSPLAQSLIKLAQADYNKLCPAPPPPGNGWTADTQNECAVPSPGNVTVVALGLDASGAITNVVTPAKVICMSESACNNIVSQKFFVYGPSPTQRCSDQTTTATQHLGDADVQAKISQMP